MKVYNTTWRLCLRGRERSKFLFDFLLMEGERKARKFGQGPTTKFSPRGILLKSLQIPGMELSHLTIIFVPVSEDFLL